MESSNNFQEALTEAVQAYFSQQANGKYATPVAWLKAGILFALFFTLYPLILFAELSELASMLLVIGWGFVSLLLIFNVGHDAVHGAFSRYSWVNRLLSLSFNLVGANAYSWKLKHNDAHHIHTNVAGKDHDIEVDPLLRVSPHQVHRWHFRWQHWYWPFVYALFSLLIIFLVDFQIFIQERKANQPFFQPLREWVVLIMTKLLYLIYIFVIPIFIAGFALEEVLFAFFTFHLINGLCIGLIFQPSHYFLESRFFAQQEEGERQWHRHQLATTVDISPDHRWLSQLVGSLNANVPHHMYPKVSHVHYPKLSAIIQTLADQYGVPYHRKSLWEALRSHVLHLKKLAQPDAH
ncbi:MAG: fatty acid desaturase family protein [Flammeovirgaceae bacterium]